MVFPFGFRAVFVWFYPLELVKMFLEKFKNRFEWLALKLTESEKRKIGVISIGSGKVGMCLRFDEIKIDSNKRR